MPNATDGGWLKTEVTWLPPASNSIQVADDGACAVLAASRSSDCTNPGRNLPIAIAGVGVCDNDSPAWGGYFEARLKPTGEAFVQIEFEAINERGTNNKPLSPYDMFVQAGVAPIWIGSGGSVGSASNPDKTPVYPADMAMGILNNGETFRYGITFQATSLTGCDGYSGTADALQLAKGHQISWYSAAGVQLTITSQATQPAVGMQIVATDWGLNIQNNGSVIANVFPAGMLEPGGTALALLIKTETGALQFRQVILSSPTPAGYRTLMVPA